MSKQVGAGAAWCWPLWCMLTSQWHRAKRAVCVIVGLRCLLVVLCSPEGVVLALQQGCCSACHMVHSQASSPCQELYGVAHLALYTNSPPQRHGAKLTLLLLLLLPTLLPLLFVPPQAPMPSRWRLLVSRLWQRMGPRAGAGRGAGAGLLRVCRHSSWTSTCGCCATSSLRRQRRSDGCNVVAA